MKNARNVALAMNNRNPTTDDTPYATGGGCRPLKAGGDDDTMSPGEVKARLRRGARLLGLDLGRKTIGLALSDGLWMSASPLQTIRRSRFHKDAEALMAVVKAHDVEALVLGLPVEMDGSEGKRCQSTRQFVKNLRGLPPPLATLPLALWDERLSTVAVQRMLIDDMDMSRQKRAQHVDKFAAAFILQGFMDALSHIP